MNNQIFTADISKNGIHKYRPNIIFNTVALEWIDPSIPVSGTVTLTVDGDTFGDSNIIDLMDGQRARKCTASVPMIELTVSGLAEINKPLLRVYLYTSV